MTEQLKGQWDLQQLPVADNRTFLRALYDAELDQKIVVFEKQASSGLYARECDPAMDIETFLQHFRKRMHVRLHMGTTVPKSVYYCAYGELYKNESDRFAIMECAYVRENIVDVLKIFREICGYDLRDRDDLRLV